MPGFLLPAIRSQLLARLSRFGRAQTTNFFRISQQWPIDFQPISCLHDLTIRIGYHFAKNPDRACRQIQLGEHFRNPRSQQRCANSRTFLHCKRTQDLALNAGVHHFDFNQRLSSAFCLARWQKASTRVLAA